MQHVVLEVIDGVLGRGKATSTIRKLSCKEFWKKVLILPGDLGEARILSELCREDVHRVSIGIEQVAFMQVLPGRGVKVSAAERDRWHQHTGESIHMSRQSRRPRRE